MVKLMVSRTLYNRPRRWSSMITLWQLQLLMRWKNLWLCCRRIHDL